MLPDMRPVLVGSQAVMTNSPTPPPHRADDSKRIGPFSHEGTIDVILYRRLLVMRPLIRVTRRPHSIEEVAAGVALAVPPEEQDVKLDGPVSQARPEICREPSVSPSATTMISRG